MKNGDRIIPPHQTMEVLNVLRDAKDAVSRLPCMLNRFSECDNQAIQSHTLSASVLRQIAENGELYELNLEPIPLDGESKCKPRRIGVRAATSFKGFCKHHDQSIFKSIDAKNMAPSAKNFELLFFRALAQEITKKAANTLVLRTIYFTEDFLRSDGVTELAAIRTALGLRDNFFDFDRIGQSRHRGDEQIQFTCYDLSCAPSIAGIGILNPEASFNYFPEKDEYDGRVFRNVLFCLLPMAFGQRVAFAWPKGTNQLVKPLLDRFLAAKNNLLEFAIQFCLEHCECSYFKPSLWMDLDGRSVDSLISLMSKNTDGLPYDLKNRPLKDIGIDFEYTFMRQHTNSTWAKLYYGREKVR